MLHPTAFARGQSPTSKAYITCKRYRAALLHLFVASVLMLLPPQALRFHDLILL